MVSAFVATVIAAVAGWPVYVRPQIDPLRNADAIFVLGGPGYDRYTMGIRLGVEGWAPTVVLSNPNGPGDAWLNAFCATSHDKFSLHCFSPNPETTKGEGQELRRLATQYGWHTVIVVTFRPHISRARFILEKCFAGELVMVESKTELSAASWTAEYLLQTVGYARAVLQPSC